MKGEIGNCQRLQHMWDAIAKILKPIVDALPAPPPLPQELEELEGRARPLCASGGLRYSVRDSKSMICRDR